MASMTDRYIATVVRGIPRNRRSDIERELQDVIAEEVESFGDDVDPATAERRVLTNLGDPEVLAAQYAERRWSPVSPRLYGSYIRRLSISLWISMPLAFLSGLVGTLLRGDDLPYVLAAATNTALIVGLIVAVIVTAVHYAMDRRDQPAIAPASSWTPESLDADGSTQPQRRASAIITIVVLACVGLLIVVQQFASVVHDAVGTPIPLINPDLWSFWLPALLLLLLLQIARNVAIVWHPRPSRTLAWANLAIQAASVAMAVTLLTTGRFFNPAYAEALGIPWPGLVAGIVGAIFGVIIVVSSIADVIGEFVRSSRN